MPALGRSTRIWDVRASIRRRRGQLFSKVLAVLFGAFDSLARSLLRVVRPWLAASATERPEAHRESVDHRQRFFLKKLVSFLDSPQFTQGSN